MKTRTLIAIGVGTIIVGGVAAVALGSGGTATPHGLTWDEKTCMVTEIDQAALQKWFEQNARKLISEYDITTGEELLIATLKEGAPPSCADKFPPQSGTPEDRLWQLALAIQGELLQQLVDTIRAEAEGAAAAWQYDPAVAFANAVTEMLKR